ncbi:MAG: DUF6103 family protein [Bacteroidales bacterium]|nr:DUF6103 family protein [Bacteroidales bacterium]
MEKDKGNTKALQVTVNYDDKKLEAMLYFMEEKNVTVESAMQEHLNDLYEKYVPSAMRRYLSRNDASEQEQQGGKPGKRQAAEPGQESASTKKRQTREQNQNAASPSEEAQAGEPAEENNQGMSMRM